jgi:GT2 family glycosyltransferase
LAAAFPHSAIFNAEAYGGWDRSTVREVDIVSGCFLLIETELWRSLGGFDCRFFMYGEEADLCLRAARLGAKPAVTPAATITHFGGQSPQLETERMIRLLTAKAELIKRHFAPISRSVGLTLFALWPFLRVVRAYLLIATDGSAEARTCQEIWQRRAEWRYGLRTTEGAASSRNETLANRTHLAR